MLESRLDRMNVCSVNEQTVLRLYAFDESLSDRFSTDCSRGFRARLGKDLAAWSAKPQKNDGRKNGSPLPHALQIRKGRARVGGLEWA